MSEIVLSRHVSCKRDKVWSILIDPSRWWGEDVVLEAKPGGRFFEPWQDAQGAHVTEGQVCEIVAPSLLVLDWRDADWSFSTRVRFVLERNSDITELCLTHRGWDDAPDAARDELISSHRAGWAMHLDALVRAVHRAGS